MNYLLIAASLVLTGFAATAQAQPQTHHAHARAYVAQAQRAQAPASDRGFTAFNIHFDRSLSN